MPKLTDFIKSLIVELIAAIFVAAVTFVITPFIPSLTEIRISLSTLIIAVTITALIFSAIHSVQIQRLRRVKRSEPSRKGAKSFSCHICGEPFEAFPPDDMHLKGSILRLPNAIPIKYTCENRACMAENTIFWVSTKGVFLKA